MPTLHADLNCIEVTNSAGAYCKISIPARYLVSINQTTITGINYLILDTGDHANVRVSVNNIRIFYLKNGRKNIYCSTDYDEDFEALLNIFRNCEGVSITESQNHINQNTTITVNGLLEFSNMLRQVQENLGLEINQVCDSLASFCEELGNVVQDRNRDPDLQSMRGRMIMGIDMGENLYKSEKNRTSGGDQKGLLGYLRNKKISPIHSNIKRNIDENDPPF